MSDHATRLAEEIEAAWLRDSFAGHGRIGPGGFADPFFVTTSIQPAL
jgi:hypothetical protein